MNTAKIKFSEEDIRNLTAIMEKNEKVKIECTPQMSGVWFHDQDWQMELRILFLFHFKLIISRVAFLHQRKGTMTAVLDYLIHFCKEHQIQVICAQSVETKEMASFCTKNGFFPDPNATLMNKEGTIIGDYILKIH